MMPDFSFGIIPALASLLMRNIAWAILVSFFFLFLEPEAWSDSECRPLGLAHLTGSENCWAQFSLPTKIPGASSDFCIPKAKWLEGLANMESYGHQCGKGKWKARGEPQNREGVAKQLHLDFILEETSETSAATVVSVVLWQIEKVRNRVSEIFEKNDELGIIRRLVLNENVPGTQLGLYRMLGFVHVFTASGIHLYSLARMTEGVMEVTCDLMEIPVGVGLWISRILSVIIWLCAWLLSGMRLGMITPWLVILSKKTASWLGLRWRKFSPLILSLVLNASPGRFFYGLAVGGGFLVLEEWREFQSTKRSVSLELLGEHVALSFGSWIFTAIFELWTREPVSLATPILSLCTLPFFSLVVYPLISVTLLADTFHWHGLVAVLVPAIGIGVKSLILFLSRLVVGYPLLWIFSKTAFLCGVFLALVILFFRKRVAIGFGVALLILVFRIWIIRSPQETHTAKLVEQLDVGQGDSALVQGDAANGMIDVGGPGQLGYDSWIRLFAERGISRLDWVAFTHLDQDHRGAAAALAKLMPVACFATSREELGTDRGRKLQDELRALHVAFQDFATPCVPFPVHGPFHERAFAEAKNGNRNMSAFWIPLHDGKNYFSMGDAEKEQEYFFMNWAQSFHSQPGSIILKVSHHGSRFSTSDHLLEGLRPCEAWISCGIGNHYGHPTLQTLKFLSTHQILTKRTDLEGSLKE